jgi:hypothetical protein
MKCEEEMLRSAQGDSFHSIPGLFVWLRSCLPDQYPCFAARQDELRRKTAQEARTLWVGYAPSFGLPSLVTRRPIPVPRVGG